MAKQKINAFKFAHQAINFSQITCKAIQPSEYMTALTTLFDCRPGSNEHQLIDTERRDDVRISWLARLHRPGDQEPQRRHRQQGSHL